jgi:nucleotide-binding universal stress UspA family protein
LLRLLHRTSVPVAVVPAGHGETGPFRHIGVAVDDSPEGAAAVAYAYELAARDGSAVTLVRAMPPASDGSVGERERLRERLAVQEQLDRVAELAPPGVNPQARLLHGDPATVLPKAFDGTADLVVCGSHGYGAVQRALAGSVSKPLLEAATQPVLVVRTGRSQ